MLNDKRRGGCDAAPSLVLVRPEGLEPPHLAPEASALSTELRAHQRSVYRAPTDSGNGHVVRQVPSQGLKPLPTVMLSLRDARVVPAPSRGATAQGVDVDFSPRHRVTPW